MQLMLMDHIIVTFHAISLDLLCTDDEEVVWNAETARPCVQHAHALLAESNQEEFAVKVHNNYTHHSTLLSKPCFHLVQLNIITTVC